MADIFISYSKTEPEYTKALASDLQAQGYTTWWDASLLPGDEFPDLIKRQIDMAQVVIVIWTEASVTSRWVRAEAKRGDDQGKLITLCTPGFDFGKIPMPFNTLHCELVTNREKIVASLRERKITGSGSAAAQGIPAQGQSAPAAAFEVASGRPDGGPTAPDRAGSGEGAPLHSGAADTDHDGALPPALAALWRWWQHDQKQERPIVDQGKDVLSVVSVVAALISAAPFLYAQNTLIFILYVILLITLGIVRWRRS